MKLKPLSQQVLVITGATSGIGLATVQHAAEAGASIFMVARNEGQLRELCMQLQRRNIDVGYAVADVGDEAQLRSAAEAAIDRFGCFDSWVSIAGVAIYSPILQTPRQQHERLFLTNYWGVVNSCMVAVPHLRSRGGALIIVGSVVSDIGTPLLGVYAAAKHAAKGFVDSLRIELLAERAPIAVTLIKPSGINTPLAESASNRMHSAACIPPPAYSPDLVAKTILYAATHARRELTVGGIGALQIWENRLAPALADRVSTWMIPFLRDKRRPPSQQNNLDSTLSRGRTRSIHERSFRHSMYMALQTRRIGTWLLAGALLTTAALLASRISRLRQG